MNPLQVIVPLLAAAVIAAQLAVFSAAAGGKFPAKLTLERTVPVRGVGLEHLKARDRFRHQRMLLGSSSSSSSTNATSVVEFPVEGSWNPFTVGLYYTRVKLGNPPKEFYVQIDTGSDILWVTCNPCNGCPTSSGLNIQLELFNPDNSSTAKRITCSDDMCTSAIQIGEAVCSNSSSCGYSSQYGDGSGTSGYYVSDTLYFDTITGDEKTANSSATIVFGCSTSVSGDLTKSDRAVDGIFGFGRQELSVISQLSSLGVAPKAFSHCLKGSDSGGGILVLGEIVESGIVYTPLVQSQVHYNLNLESIAVNGQTVSINSSVFTTSDTQGTIVDSGTTLAYLAEEAFDPFVNAILASVSSSGGASMSLNPQDYLLEQGSVGNTPIWCIGWQKNQGQGITILGDMVLKDKIVVYDLANQRIGWVNYDCSLAVNVTASVRNVYVNSNQMDASGSSPAAFWKQRPADIAVFFVYIFILAILHG